jgi:hypothetical protein
VAWRRRQLLWATVVLSVASALLFLGGAVLSDGVALGSGTSGPKSTAPAAVAPALHATPAGWNWGNFNSIPIPQGLACFATFAGGVAQILLFGPACLNPSGPNLGAINLANAHVAAENIITTLSNYLNITNAETANLNATFQELMGYYSDRAEAIVPYFLNDTTWNNTIADLIAVDSGLVPSIEGVETAIAHQQYQDWNATAASWDAAFGPGAPFSGTSASFEQVTTNDYPFDGPSVPIALNGYDVNVSAPWELWTFQPLDGTGGNPIYFNMAPGGTIVTTGVYGAVTATVDDLTQGFSFAVPTVTTAAWQNQTVPIESTVHHIGQFDLLKVTCSATCNNYVETSGAYAFMNVSSALYQPVNLGANQMVPQLFSWVNGPYVTIVPRYTTSTCISFAPSPLVGSCYTWTSPTEGNSTTPGGGPGAVVAGNKSLSGFATTAQSLVNSTLTLAYDYWLTLRAITENGTYNIPANCAIPTPSDAFPEATDFANYKLDANNLEAAYLAYLNAVAREYGEVFTNQVGFCQDPNLGFSFNWTGSWKLSLNITASVYIANGTTPLYLNGTADPTAAYANVGSWPVYNIQPALLYPFEYQMDVPLNAVFPVPINDPIAGVLVNYPGNLYYGQTGFTPKWGVPTYVTLSGNGPYENISGTITNIASGRSPTQGDAIEITSCVLNGITPENPCDISVTYFSYFSVGLVHAILPPVPYPSGGGGLGALGSNCGFSALNQFYDGWAGYIGSAVAGGFSYFGNALSGIPIIGGGLAYIVDGLGCIVAWIIVILLFVLFIYIAARVLVAVYRGVRGSGRSKSENVS